MKRLEDNNNNSEFIKLILIGNYNDQIYNKPNKDIISYLNKDINNKDKIEKLNKERIILKIEEGFKYEIKRGNINFKKNKNLIL